MLNQIYLNPHCLRPIAALYLTTALLVLSNILNANPVLSNRYKKNGFETYADSLPAKKIALGSSSKTNSDSLILNDSSFTIVADTISKNDTINKADDGEIKDVITYKAVDSIVYDMNTKKMYLYNGSDVHYQKIQLNADLVDFDWTTFTLTSPCILFRHR